MPLLEPSLTQQICHYERVSVHEPIRLRAILGLEGDRTATAVRERASDLPGKFEIVPIGGMPHFSPDPAHPSLDRRTGIFHSSPRGTSLSVGSLDESRHSLMHFYTGSCTLIVNLRVAKSDGAAQGRKTLSGDDALCHASRDHGSPIGVHPQEGNP